MPKWQPIPSVPGYEASIHGQIRRGARVLAQYLHASPRGEYLRVQVWIDGRVTNRRVNRLVCEAFHGAPQAGHHACHIDGNSQNNRAANLRWGTARENYFDQVRHGRAHIPPATSVFGGDPTEHKFWQKLVNIDAETFKLIPLKEQRAAKKFFSNKRLDAVISRKKK